MESIVIVDDHEIIVEGLLTMLKPYNNIDVLATFNDGENLLNFLKTKQPNILLLDINLGKDNGIDICKKVTSLYPNINVIILSNYNENSFIKAAMRNKAKGYLLKNSSQEEIVKAIQRVNEGEIYLSKILKEQLLNNSFGIKKSDSFIPNLTRREKEVLSAISKEMINSEIAEQLFISIKTVEAHRTNLLLKFNVKNTAGLIKEAYIKGLL